MHESTSTKWGPTYVWESFEEFLEASELPSGVHHAPLTARDGRTSSLDLLIKVVPGTPMLVNFYGAQSHRKDGDTPIFRGVRTSEVLGTSYVLVHDPTLSLDSTLGIGWHEGSAGLPFAPIVQRALNHVREVAGTPRVVLWGGSAGGYAALRNVGAVKDAVAFVWNPQTAITRYNTSPVQRYARVAFGSDDLATGARGTPGIQLDLSRVPHPNWTDAPVAYLQEGHDRHVSRHLAYLLRRTGYPDIAHEVQIRDAMFGLVDTRFYLHQSMWAPGHTPPSREGIRIFLRELIDTSRDIEVVLRDLPSASREFMQVAQGDDSLGRVTDSPAPIHPAYATRRVLQWGSRFGREVAALAAISTDTVVTRSVLGQSAITTFSRSNEQPPKTALNFGSATAPSKRRQVLDDRRASVVAALKQDEQLNAVVFDPLEEVLGVDDAGGGFIVTSHGFLRRADGTELVHHPFGSPEHLELWGIGLERFAYLADELGLNVIYLDVDPRQLARTDWEWLGIPSPSDTTLETWDHYRDVARRRFKTSEWVVVDAAERSLLDAVEDTARHLEKAFTRET